MSEEKSDWLCLIHESPDCGCVPVITMTIEELKQHRHYMEQWKMWKHNYELYLSMAGS